MKRSQRSKRLIYETDPYLTPILIYETDPYSDPDSWNRAGDERNNMKDKKKPVDVESVFGRMERLAGGAAKGKKKAQQEAQDRVYDSWEAADGDQALALLQEATQLDPNNVDAWLGLLRFSTLPDEEWLDMLRRLVAMGQKNLGAEFKAVKGIFWGVHETRPYMRARGALAQRLVKLGRFEEAIAEHEAMLELNPNDNQGIRYGLMGCYLAVDRLDGARRLFKKYDERKYGATWAWAYVLERFLSAALKQAEKGLQDARQQNPHAQAYFLGHRQLPKSMPRSYTIGSREEAVIAWEMLQPAWEKHPAAGEWLAGQRGKDAGRFKLI